MGPDLQGTSFYYYEWHPSCCKHNVLFFRDHILNTFTITDVTILAPKIMNWFGIPTLYFYAPRKYMSGMSQDVLDKENIKWVSHHAGTCDLYSIRRS